MCNSVQDLVVLQCLHVSSCASKSQQIINVYQLLPYSGWIKVNIDGAACEALGRGGYDRVFRTSRGFVKGCFAFGLDFVQAFEAELCSTIVAIDYAWQFGWDHIWLESDSSYVVSLLASRSLEVSSSSLVSVYSFYFKDSSVSYLP